MKNSLLAAMYQVLDTIRTMDTHAVHTLMDDTLRVANNVTMNSFSELVDNRPGNAKKYQ